MSDLVKRLRDRVTIRDGLLVPALLAHEAAAEIERLRAENDMMRSLIIDAPTKEERDEIFNRRFGDTLEPPTH